MELLKLELSDLDKIDEIEKTIFVDPWPMKEYAYEIEHNKYAYLYKLVDNNEIIGYFDVWLIDDAYGTIASIGIKKEYQGKGYSKLLMDKILELANKLNIDQIDLEVRTSNIKAISLYQKFGFEMVSVRSKYYSNGEDALLMVKVLKGDGNYEKIYIGN